MIRTSLVMSISSEDARKQTFLVNGAHLGLLSPTSQNIHVQTNHKPLQLIVAFSPDENSDESEQIDLHQNQIEVWQAFAAMLSKRGCGDLHALLSQYNLNPNLLLCLTEQRLQVWMPDDLALFLLRDDELRRIKPVELKDNEAIQNLARRLSCFSVTVRPDDHFLLLPPGVTSYFASGEIAEIIGGLRQLPAKMSDLFNSARLRGFVDEKSWIAWQILRLEPDVKPPADDVSWIKSVRTRMAGMTAGSASENNEESDSEYLSEEEEQEKSAQREAEYLLLKRRKILLGAAILVLLAVLVLSGIFVAGKLGQDSEETTTEETTVPVTTRRPSPTPVLTTTPEPTTTEQIFHYFVNVRRLNLRTEPNQQSDLLTTLNRDDLLEKMAEPEEGWVMVRTEDGLEGYVYFDYVAEQDLEIETGTEEQE